MGVDQRNHPSAPGLPPGRERTLVMASCIWSSAAGSTLTWLRVQDSEFRVQGSGFRVQGSGFRVQDSEFRVQGSGFRVLGFGFWVLGLWCRVCG